jgi:hypothetical protein
LIVQPPKAPAAKSAPPGGSLAVGSALTGTLWTAKPKASNEGRAFRLVFDFEDFMACPH